MKFINQKIVVFLWKLIVACPLSFQNILRNIFFSFLKSPSLKRNIFSKKNIDIAFPEFNEEEKRNLFNKNLKSMIGGIFDTGKAWFWNDSKIVSLIQYEISGLHKLNEDSGSLLIFKHSHHLELDSRILGMHCELYGVERVHNSPFMQKVQSTGRLKGLNGLADKNSPITFIKWLKKNKIVLYAIDQDYGLKNSTNIDFFGIKTATTNAPIKIVDSTQCNVLFLNSYYESDKLILSIEEINISNSKSMIQEISLHVEASIREKPSEYLWQHRRFKSTMGKERFYEC